MSKPEYVNVELMLIRKIFEAKLTPEQFTRYKELVNVNPSLRDYIFALGDEPDYLLDPRRLRESQKS
jgi:hypothetical protein